MTDVIGMKQIQDMVAQVKEKSKSDRVTIISPPQYYNMVKEGFSSENVIKLDNHSEFPMSDVVFVLPKDRPSSVHIQIDLKTGEIR